MKKNILCGVLAFALAFSLVACNIAGDTEENSSSQAEVTTTEEAVTVAAIVTSAETTEETTTEATTEETAETTTKPAESQAITTDKTETTTTTAEQTTTGAAAGKIFTSTLGYTLTMPDDWDKADWPAGLEGCMDSKGNNFTVLSSPYGKAFENMNKSYFTDYFNNYPKMEFKDYQKIEISGYKGHRIDARNNYSQTTSIFQTQIYVAVNKKILLFTFTDKDGSNQQKIEDMISSISINYSQGKIDDISGV